jgi:uncharacterized membrane protein YdjX (TVP38/TMEM64 family)
MPLGIARERKKLLIKLSLAAAGLLILAVLALLGVNLHALVERGLALLRRGGPWAFFSAMAVLPAVGVPLLTFALTAGPAFAGQMGMGAVVAAGLAAITVNVMLAYWLARRWLRPWLVRLFVRLGYKVPQVEPADMTDLIVLLRVTPGIPFPVQNYLLGLADVPFGKYFGISCAAAWANNVAFIVFGDALLNGKGKLIFCAVSLIAALTAAAHLVRRHYAGRAKRVGSRASS